METRTIKHGSVGKIPFTLPDNSTGKRVRLAISKSLDGPAIVTKTSDSSTEISRAQLAPTTAGDIHFVEADFVADKLRVRKYFATLWIENPDGSSSEWRGEWQLVCEGTVP